MSYKKFNIMISSGAYKEGKPKNAIKIGYLDKETDVYICKIHDEIDKFLKDNDLQLVTQYYIYDKQNNIYCPAKVY